MGLWHTASFYHIPFDASRLRGHTLLATPHSDKDDDYTGEENDNDMQIDETTPSDDDRFAESILQGGEYTTVSNFPQTLMSGMSENPHTFLRSQAHALSQENHNAPADEMTRGSNGDDYLTQSVFQRGEHTDYS